MIDIPAETTISRYAIPARNLLMRCEASFRASTPKERSAPDPIPDVLLHSSETSRCARTGPHMPFYEESDATRAARLFRLADGRRLRCLLKAHSGVGADAPEHDLVPV